MCKFYKFYICAVVGIIIEWLDNMHGITTKKKIENLNRKFKPNCRSTNKRKTNIEADIKEKEC